MEEQLYIRENQKILVSDLLFYMQNKLQSTPNDVIVRICSNFYDENHIWEDKGRLIRQWEAKKNKNK